MRTVTQQIIGHVDGDAFYVACERVRHPELERKPVGVLGNWGACIIAKSYELKARGVHTGMPIWDAQKVCPEAIYVKRDFEWYEVLSRRMLDVVKQLSPLVEYYSVDELFFDASLLVSVHKKAPLEAARELQRRILYEVGVPVTVGISSSKLLAKLASDTAKPFGCAVAITPEDRQKLLMGKSVEDITGIAKRRRKTLESHGIYTCDQFVKADRLRIRTLQPDPPLDQARREGDARNGTPGGDDEGRLQLQCHRRDPR